MHMSASGVDFQRVWGNISRPASKGTAETHSHSFRYVVFPMTCVEEHRFVGAGRIFGPHLASGSHIRSSVEYTSGFVPVPSGDSELIAIDSRTLKGSCRVLLLKRLELLGRDRSARVLFGGRSRLASMPLYFSAILPVDESMKSVGKSGQLGRICPFFEHQWQLGWEWSFPFPPFLPSLPPLPPPFPALP